MRKRFLLLTLVLAALAAVSLPSLAAYPDKPIRLMIVPSVPGGAPDILMRALANPMVQERFRGLGIEASPSTPEEFRELARLDAIKWTKVIKFSGAKVDYLTRFSP